MSVEISSAATDRTGTVFDAIFSGLPPLDSAEYLELLDNASVKQLPAQVLARAYRQLAASGSEEAANATLVRLVGDERYDYVAIIRKLASEHFIKGSYSYSEEDLVQEAVFEIVRLLPTSRGGVAEGAWVLFLRHRFEDARRALYGRFGGKDPEGRVEPQEDETGALVDPVEETDGAAADWHVQVKESGLPWLTEFIQQTVLKIQDPLIRYVAEDQFGDDPSPISAGTSEGGKPPLTEQLGLHRSKVSRARTKARMRLAAELMARKEREIDMDWIRKFAER